MKRIFKYPLPISDINIIQMPKGAKILTAQMQDEEPFIWALVEPGEPDEPRAFRVIGTGHEIYETLVAYISTFQMDGGRLVFHVFEVANEVVQ